ncbi:hypothetical protein [Chamaesiphon polymorphus]|uniref:Uncharacterized protein n=1 Tax=Chamaesiphon polymorphus CCALA 037 TaxID=2107692 RepID=A0A2T1GNR0_9CYAN|nr:hypothetical protein [Chamaesiphon polymorphus]PSB59582.1 hypothetical protein C7B77_00320 [Chamaesiphon polymorphus CCALA 037]
MTIAQDKYCYIDTNPDGSRTLKAIVEHVNEEGSDTASLIRFHVDSQIVLIAGLWDNHFSFANEMVLNQVWQQYLKPTGVDPGAIKWVEHDIKLDHVDIRHPFQNIDYYDNEYQEYYRWMTPQWDGEKFIYPEPSRSKKFGKRINDNSHKPLFKEYFGTPEEITDRFNWRKGVNRLDVDYTIQKVNEDGSTILKTILFWEHPDYPAHSLVRIWCRSKTAIVIITEPLSNLPPTQNIGYDPTSTNHVERHLSQVIGEIRTKYSHLLLPYQADNIGWFLETKLAHSFEDEGRGYGSLIKILKLRKDELGEIEIEKIYIKDSQRESQIFLRSEPLGTAESSFQELGWFNRR